MSSSRKQKTREEETRGCRNAVYTVVKIVVVVLIVMVIYRLGSMAYTYGERIFGEPAMAEAPGTDISITVEETGQRAGRGWEAGAGRADPGCGAVCDSGTAGRFQERTSARNLYAEHFTDRLRK